MSIYHSGSLRRLGGGYLRAITKQLKLVNLKAAKRVVITFDPFTDNVKHTRDFAHYLSSPKVTTTNPSCILKTEVVCDRREPNINVEILPAIAESSGIKNVVLRAGNLTTFELLEELNKHITVLAPKEQVLNTVQTKSEKKSIGKKR